MLEESLFRHLIAENYTPQSLGKIREVLAAHHSHRIVPVAHGLFAASSSQTPDSLSGYQNVWVRDNVMVANSFRLRGQLEPAIACVQGLTRFFETQLPRFCEIIEDPTHRVKEDPQRRPHIRFIAETLAESAEKWPHAQNDALGGALWLRFVLANTGVMSLTSLDASVYGSFPSYFKAIEYWRDRDSGAWEERRKVNNSSIGAVVAGLEELLRYHDNSQASFPLRLSPDQLRLLIAEGRKRLEATLPFESPPERMVDSAVLSLVYPLDVVRSRAAQDAILNVVQARLRGEIGIRRYANDSYFCQDYDEWFPAGEMSSDFSDRVGFRDAHLQPNREAQWCLFDPLLSVVYGQRYLADRSDQNSLRRQVRYFNRSLAQVTATGQCPELYFQKNGRYIANDHTPLAWTQANQALALHLMEQSVGD